MHDRSIEKLTTFFPFLSDSVYQKYIIIWGMVSSSETGSTNITTQVTSLPTSASLRFFNSALGSILAS
jgi:hypothetical protein